MSEKDIRMVRLAKWQIPKTESVMNYGPKETYLAVGYFDLIEVEKVTLKNKEHPLLEAYYASHRKIKNNDEDCVSNEQIEAESEETGILLENYTVQELMAFTNTGEGWFDSGDVKKFWEQNTQIMFVSLIHFDNESRLSDVLQKIRENFDVSLQKKECLYYFCFGYSGIILFVKGMDLKEFLEKMFFINYDYKGKSKLIRDSYSFYGFPKAKLTSHFEKFEREGYCDVIDGSDTFSVSVNVGIQNYNLYNKFIDEIKSVTPDIKIYGLFGRHDCSLVNEQANVNWLVYVQYLLNKYTIKSNDISANKVLLTHETFVKLPDMSGFEDTEEKVDNKFLMDVEKELDTLCNEFLWKVEREQYNGEYAIPVQAVRYSILSILKNRFAEDFVLCMYQSFREFLRYLMEKMDHEDVSQFDECFRSYFRGLNSLVNSAMHSERQFIQATAFNAIIYDVPSKIMAFYVALVDWFQKLIGSSKDKRYTFLLTPSFSNEIILEVISYAEEKPPHDRILMVSINEASLYNPKAVIRRMAHEVAHFVGDDLRCRSLRKKNIKISVIYIILSHVIHISFLQTDHIFTLIDDIEEEISKVSRFSDNYENYSEDLLKLIPEISNEFFCNPKIREHISGYVRKFLELFLGASPVQNEFISEMRSELEAYVRGICKGNSIICSKISEGRILSLTEIEILTKYVWRDIEEEVRYINHDRDVLLKKGRISQSMISRLGSGILNSRTIGQYGKSLISIYSEAFSDVQMVLLTGIEYYDYMKGFLIDEKIDVDRLTSRLDDLSRIAMVTLALQFTGVWEVEVEVQDDLEENEKRNLERFMGIVNSAINVLKSTVTDQTKEKTKEYFQLTKEHVHSCMAEVDHFWYVKESEREEGDIKFYIYENVFVYLLKCISKSWTQYSSPEINDEKAKLRETINTVNSFEDVESVFSTICETINEYKNKLFSEIVNG